LERNGIYLEGVRKTTKNLRRVGASVDIPEYNSGAEIITTIQ
jgi:hypothetical protein